MAGAALRPPSASPSSRMPSSSRPRSRSCSSASATPSDSCASMTSCARRVPPRARTGQWRAPRCRARGARRGTRVARAPTALEAAARLITRRGMVVLISDLLDGLAPTSCATVRGLRAAGHEVVVLHVHGSRRARPAAVRTKRCSSIRRASSRSRRRVADVRAAYQAHRARGASPSGARSLTASAHRYELVITDAPFGVPLRRAFAARQAP